MLSFIAERAVETATALVRPGGQTMSYGTLGMATAAIMQAVGERLGEVARRIVGVAVDDGAGFVASVLAVLEAGGVALPLDPRRGLGALEHEARSVRALGVIVGDRQSDRLDVLAVDASRRELPAEACLLADAIGLRALHDRRALGLGVDAAARHAGLDASARVAFVGAPAATSTLVGTILPTLRAGGALLPLNGLAPVEQARAIGALGATVVAGAVDELGALAAEAAGLDVARVFVAGAASPAALAPLSRAFASARLTRVFDSAEALRVAAADGDATAWTALPDVDFASVDEHTADVAAATVMMGYLDDDEATRAAFAVRDGRRVVRARDVTVVDAERLERAIAATPGVREAAVLAVRDSRGDRLYAFVSGERAMVPEHPARLVALGSLPRRADGAVDREALRRMASVD